MTLEKYKELIYENLVKIDGKSEAQRLMNLYEDDFPTFYKEKWSIGAVVAGIRMGY